MDISDDTTMPLLHTVQSSSRTSQTKTTQSLRRRLVATISDIRGYIALFGCILMMFCAGVLFSFGNLTPYLASFLAYYDLTNSGETLTECTDLISDTYSTYVGYCNTIFTISVICEAALLPLGAKIEMLFNCKVVCFVGGSIIALGFLLSYFVLASFAADYISSTAAVVLVAMTYGGLSGFGGGITYVPPIIIGTRWFDANQALVTSVITLGWTVAPFLFNYCQTLYINPSNDDVDANCGFILDDTVLTNTESAFLLFTFVLLAVTVIATLAITNKESEENVAIDSEQESEEQSEQTNFDTVEAAKSVQFWQLFLGATLNMICYTFVNAEWKVFGQQYLIITDDTFLTSVGSISMFVSAFLQLGWGAIMDQNKSFRTVMSCMMFICCLFFTTLIFVKDISSETSKGVVYGIWLCVLHACLIGYYTILPMTVEMTFGAKFSGVILGWIYVGEIGASLIQTGLFYAFQSEWDVLCIWFVALCFIGLLNSMTYKYDIKFIKQLCTRK